MAKAKKVAAAKEEKVAAPVGAAAPSETAAENLENAVENETKAPAGVKTSKEKPQTQAAGIKVHEDEDGLRSITPTGNFESVGNEIFNREGRLVGTEANASDASRKADRFNGLTRSPNGPSRV